LVGPNSSVLVLNCPKDGLDLNDEVTHVIFADRGIALTTV